MRNKVAKRLRKIARRQTETLFAGKNMKKRKVMEDFADTHMVIYRRMKAMYKHGVVRLVKRGKAIK